MCNNRFENNLSVLARRVLTWLPIAFALFFAQPVPAFADADSAGSVIAARRDAWAERGAARPQLYSKSPVFSGDRLSTNPVGRLQVLFNDDSVLMLAPDSQATVTEYVYSAETGGNAFNLNLAKGVTSLISGRMVENEPGSMRVETPEITVGIQGTALAVESNGGVSKVMIAHATPGKPTIVICGEDQRKTYLEESGMVLIMNAEAQCVPEIRRMTADEQFFLRSLSLPLNGPGLSGAAPDAPLAPGSFQTAAFTDGAAPALAPADNIMQPSISNPMSQDFAGTYAGIVSGSYASQVMTGGFTMGVENLTTGPIVGYFYIDATTEQDASLFYQRDYVGAGIGSSGNFSFSSAPEDPPWVGAHNPDATVTSPQISVEGGIMGSSVGLSWSVQDTTPGSDFAGMTGTGSGTKVSDTPPPSPLPLP